jgi:hypothetical protein
MACLINKWQLSVRTMTSFLLLMIRHPAFHFDAGLAIKNPPKETHLKNLLKMGFWGSLGFFKFLIFYENNTNFSL